MREVGRSGAVLGRVPKVEVTGELAGEAARLRKGFLEFKLVDRPGEGIRSVPVPVERISALVEGLREKRAGERFSRLILPSWVSDRRST